MNKSANRQRFIPLRCLFGGMMLVAGAGPAIAAAPAKATPAAKALEVTAAEERWRPCRWDNKAAENRDLMVGQSQMLKVEGRLQHKMIGDPSVARVRWIGPDLLYLTGVDAGSTNLIVQMDSGGCKEYSLAVKMDPAPVLASLAIALPDEADIHVTAAGDSLLITGTVADAPAVARAMEVANAFVRKPLRPLDTRDKADAGQASSGSAAAGQAGVRVVNLLRVKAPQQVMLEVKIAEVSKTLLEKLEAGTTLKYASGSWATTLLSNFLTGSAGGLFDARKSNGNQFTLEAQKQDGLVRILAEPNVMAISGQEGSFLAGGRIFIPVAQDNNKITLEEKEFGVGLRFTPTVLAGGLINLRVAPEVSELSREGAGFTASGIPGGSILPLITTRRASTTVQLHDGQSFAIGGLIKNNLTTSLKGLPVLGEVPILGALFRSTDYQQDRSELVFVITPRLVKPLPPHFSLPTDGAPAPTPAELMLMGRLEGRAPPPAGPAGAALSIETARGFELK